MPLGSSRLGNVAVGPLPRRLLGMRGRSMMGCDAEPAREVVHRREPTRCPRKMPLLLVLTLLSGFGTALAQSPREFVPVTDEMLQSPAPADWLMWRRTLDGWGYSPLDEINRGNVGELRMVWTRALTDGSQSGTPLVYDGMMYMPILWEINLGSSVTGFPITYAVDGRQYVVVATGSGATATHFLGLTPELRPSSGNNLFIFALPE